MWGAVTPHSRRPFLSGAVSLAEVNLQTSGSSLGVEESAEPEFVATSGQYRVRKLTDRIIPAGGCYTMRAEIEWPSGGSACVGERRPLEYRITAVPSFGQLWLLSMCLAAVTK